MAAKYQSLKDEEVVRVARSAVTESAGGTFTETSIDTQLSIERGVIWMIHAIEFFLFPQLFYEVAAGAAETQTIQLTRESKDDLVNFNDADLIAMLKLGISRSAGIGTDAGPLWTRQISPHIQNYSPPLPYASQNLYLGLEATHATVQTGYVRVRYTIRTVSDKYFFRVAQALLG